MVERYLGRHREKFYAVLRIAAGLMFMQHGMQKLFGVMGGEVQTGNTLMLAAGAIELIGGFLIAVGLFTVWAALLSFVEMMFAYFMVHAPQAPWPVENRGELALLYGLVFLYVASHGSGVWSVDAMRRRGPAAVTQIRPRRVA